MSKSPFDEALDFIDKIEPIIESMDVVWEVTEETKEKAMVGGSHSKSTGRRLLTVTIPYTLTKKYIVHKLNELSSLAQELRNEINVIEMDMGELEEMFDKLNEE